MQNFPPSFTDMFLRAQAAGLLPADAGLPPATDRPWPVVLFSALGAWLAALPLLGVVAFALEMVLDGDVLDHGPVLYTVGALLLAGAVALLVARGLPLFVEQLALPALLVGQLCLGWALFRDASGVQAVLLLAALNLALAWCIPTPWLRVLLGMAASAALLVALNLPPGQDIGDTLFWKPHPQAWMGSVYLGLLVWSGLLLLQARGAHGRAAAYLESLISGACVVLWLGWALLSGPSLLLGMPLLLRELQDAMGAQAGWGGTLVRGVSVATAAAATAVLAWRWPRMRAQALPWGAGVALALLVLAAYIPALGGILLATAWLAASARWTLARAGLATAVWAIGSAYYTLAWPLADKALLLGGLGAALALLALLATRHTGRQPTSAVPVSTSKRPAALVLSALVATLLIANVGIWQKEQTIRHGQPVFVQLVPVDPRSLMQGDYMALDFAIPFGLREAHDRRQRPSVWLQPDPQLPGAYTAADAQTADKRVGSGLEVRLNPKNGSWVLVTDAWYFKEGDAEKFAAARYGEFRVLPNGTAVLVGMADARLQPIR